MNDFLEQLRALDVNDIGRWPAAFRYGLIVIIFLVVAIGGTYQFVYKDQILVLEQAQQEQVTLMAGFKQKQTKAANLEAYKLQLAEIESSFGTMLRQLPGKTEVPSLLVDISQTGLPQVWWKSCSSQWARCVKNFMLNCRFVFAWWAATMTWASL